MNTFKRLLTLYRKNGASRVPTEDYCTECLAGLLECDQELLSGFVNEVLNISSEEQFKVFTQKTYILDGEMIRVDLVFESPSQICFLEMKVHSAEGEQQLERYHRYLLHERKHQDKSVTLRYCTLYMERKESFETDVMFEQPAGLILPVF